MSLYRRLNWSQATDAFSKELADIFDLIWRIFAMDGELKVSRETNQSVIPAYMLSRVSTALFDGCFSLSFRLVIDIVHRLSSSVPIPDQSSVVPSSEEDGTGWPAARRLEGPELDSASWMAGTGGGNGNGIGGKTGRNGEVFG
jgi:hypothetical protein